MGDCQHRILRPERELRPAGRASFAGDRLQVGYPKDTVKGAPNVDHEDGHLTPEQEQALYEYYGVGYQAAGEEPETGSRTPPAVATWPQSRPLPQPLSTPTAP